jgi:predicted ATPase
MESGDEARASAFFDEAHSLWRGETLAEVADEAFAQADRTRLAELRTATEEARIDVQLALGYHASLIPELEQVVLEHPFREHLRAQLMLAMSRSGRQTEALRSHRAARAVLAEEVGLEPSLELRDLESAILQHDRAAERPDVPAAIPSGVTRLRTPLTSLIGRDDELDALTSLLSSHRLVTLVGPGGVGKTRLAIEAARELANRKSVDARLVELADVSVPDGVVSAIAAALEVPVSPDASTDLARVAEYLCDRMTLGLGS